jgi:hypothetical protein
VIRIEQTSQPIIWQVNREYLLPAISGQVRWNGNTKQFEVCDNANNGMWYKIDNTIELHNDPELAEVIQWAKKKMQSERKIEELARQYPAVKDAKEKLDIIVKLVQDISHE